MPRAACAILGSGNIATDLMLKIVKLSPHLELLAVAGIDPQSDGLARACALGIATTDRGIEGLIASGLIDRTRIVFDATSAKAHRAHIDALAPWPDVTLVDLTPAAIGPMVVPTVNLAQHDGARSVNLVTCGGQATVPIVAAVARKARVRYAEIVASIASRSAGPGTRANIDEFTKTTARALEVVGGAERGKAIIVLNPADPPILMRNTVFTLVEGGDEQAIAASVEAMVADVQRYVPGYRMKQKVQFERIRDNQPLRIPGYGELTGLKVSVLLEVEGAAHYLPAYAGNLDIMTSAALTTGERLAQLRYLSTAA